MKISADKLEMTASQSSIPSEVLVPADTLSSMPEEIRNLLKNGAVLELKVVTAKGADQKETKGVVINGTFIELPLPEGFSAGDIFKVRVRELEQGISLQILGRQQQLGFKIDLKPTDEALKVLLSALGLNEAEVHEIRELLLNPRKISADGGQMPGEQVPDFDRILTGENLESPEKLVPALRESLLKALASSIQNNPHSGGPDLLFDTLDAAFEALLKRPGAEIIKSQNTEGLQVEPDKSPALKKLADILNRMAAPDSASNSSEPQVVWNEKNLSVALKAVVEIRDSVIGKIEQTLARISREGVLSTLLRAVSDAEKNLASLSDNKAEEVRGFVKGLTARLAADLGKGVEADKREGLIRETLKDALSDFEKDLLPLLDRASGAGAENTEVLPPQISRALRIIFAQLRQATGFFSAGGLLDEPMAGELKPVELPALSPVVKELLKDPAVKAVLQLLDGYRASETKALTGPEESFLHYASLLLREAGETKGSEGKPTAALHKEMKHAYEKLKELFSSEILKGRVPADLPTETAHQFKMLDNALKGQELFQKLAPVMQAAGEPGFILFPTLLQGFVSQIQVTNHAANPDELKDGMEQKEKSGAQFERLQVVFPLPNLGEVKTDIAYRKEEIYLAFSLFGEEQARFLERYFIKLETSLSLLGFKNQSFSAISGTAGQQFPAWVTSILRPVIKVA